MEPSFLSYRAGELLIEGIPLAALVEGRETPFFLLAERQLRHAYARLAQSFSAAGVAAELRYCAKTNSEAAVLTTLAACGAGVLACHPAEVELVRACGFAADRIAYQKPVLTPRELDSVLDQGVGLVHVQSPSEVEILAAAAARAGRPVRLSLRLAAPRALSPLRVLGRRTGLSADEALAIALTLRGSRWLRVVGVNLYLGTQQRSPKPLALATRRALRLLRRLAASGVGLEEVNLGGGVPSPSLSRLTPWRLLPRLLDRGAELPAASPEVDPFAVRLAQNFAALMPEPRGRPTLVVEPGRSLVGAAGLLVSRVQAVRGRWLFLDASRDFLPESPWFASRKVLTAIEPSSAARRFVHLSGGGLNTLDVLDLHRRLPPVAAGDLLVLCDAGAYSISRASRYTGLPPAVFLLTDDGTLRLARRAETVADLTAAMTSPTPPPVPQVGARAAEPVMAVARR